MQEKLPRAIEAVDHPSEVGERDEDHGLLIIDGVHALKRHLKTKE